METTQFFTVSVEMGQGLLSLKPSNCLKEMFRGAVNVTVKLMQRQPFHSASPCLSWQSERYVLAHLEQPPFGTLSVDCILLLSVPSSRSLISDQARRQHDPICHRPSLCWSITLANSLCLQSAL